MQMSMQMMMTQARSIGTRVRQSASLVLTLTLFAITGCGNFFPSLNSTGSGSTVTNTGDYAYVVSSITSSSSSNPAGVVAGFSVGSTGTLTALSGFPFTLSFPATTAVVNPANSILYIAGSGVFYGYTITSSGALTSILNASQTQPLANADIVSMVISPDGQWLLALDASSSLVVIDEFQIGSSGLLTLEAGARYALSGSATIVPTGIAVAATGDYVAVSLGTGGDVLFSFDTTTGALTEVNQINVPTAATADQALTFDSAGATLYVARSGTDGGVVPYTIGSGGTLTPVAGAPFPVGNGPASILIDATGKFLYVGNKVDSTISGFSIGTGGVLTALGGSAYAAGDTVTSLGRDNSGKFILSTSLGSPDLKMYSFDATTSGKLDPATTASTGDPTEPAGAIAVALTH